jgi:hypothetical protein
MNLEPAPIFLSKLWAAFAGEDYVDAVSPDSHQLQVHTPDRPYTTYVEKRSMTVVVDPAAVLAIRSELLKRIRKRGEWEELDDDAAVIEEVLAKLEEGVLSASAGVTDLEFFNGYFRTHPSSPSRAKRMRLGDDLR